MVGFGRQDAGNKTKGEILRSWPREAPVSRGQLRQRAGWQYVATRRRSKGSHVKPEQQHVTVSHNVISAFDSVVACLTSMRHRALLD